MKALFSRKHTVLVLGFGALIAWIGIPLLASSGSGDLNKSHMFTQLIGGLALFLFGMEGMARDLKAVAGSGMKRILAKLTLNRWMGAVTGALVTAVVQSSSVTTVLVVGFISANLMSMAQSIGVIMGANVGTTITAQIIAFKVSKLALPMVAMGFGVQFLSQNRQIARYGSILFSLGMVFYGMKVMGDAMAPLRHYEGFVTLVSDLESPIPAIVVAAVFTALVQSSSATTGIVITMASQGLINLEMGILLAFGANIGTCITALLASIGKSREALRAAMVHVIFNVAGVLMWVGLVPTLAQWVVNLSPSYPDLLGLERLAAETPRQIANAHTLFNVINTVLFLFFTGVFARLVERLVPDRPLPEASDPRPKYLNPELQNLPDLAIASAQLEIGVLGKRVRAMLNEVISSVLSGNEAQLQRLAELDDRVDHLHAGIIAYLGRVGQEDLSREQQQKLFSTIEVANDLEHIGDLIEHDLVDLGRRRVKEGVQVSEGTVAILTRLHGDVTDMVKQAIAAFEEDDQDLAREVMEAKSDINRLVEEAMIHETSRLGAGEPKRLAAYTIETEIVEKLKRIFYYAKRIAKATASV